MPPRLSLRASSIRKLLATNLVSTECQFIRRAAPIVQLSSTNSTQQPLGGQRSFSSNPVLFKGKGSKTKKAKARQAEEEDEDDDANESEETADNPFDFSTLDEGIRKALEKLKNDLSKLRTGGRFNPEVLENLRVHLSKDSKHSERLGDLAQVLPKGGRSLMILVGEKDHIKHVVSAIQGSRDLNLQPTPDPHNPLQLNVPIPPPTKESRDLALSAASKAGEAANGNVRNARGDMQKRLNAMFKKKSARPDDLAKAGKQLEATIIKTSAEVKKMVDAARKTMEHA